MNSRVNVHSDVAVSFQFKPDRKLGVSLSRRNPDAFDGESSVAARVGSASDACARATRSEKTAWVAGLVGDPVVLASLPRPWVRFSARTKDAGYVPVESGSDGSVSSVSSYG